MGLCIRGLPLPLQGPRKAELGGNATWIKLRCATKFLLRVHILLLLRIQIAKEVVRVSVVGRQRSRLAEFGERLLGLSIIAVQ